MGKGRRSASIGSSSTLTCSAWRALAAETLNGWTFIRSLCRTCRSAGSFSWNRQNTVTTHRTRMHSSRMRTGRSLTVWLSLLRGGVLCSGGVCSRGVSAPGGCLLPGGSARGGCLLQGGGYIPACTEADTPSPSPRVDRHRLVKILPWPNFVAAGNKRIVINVAKRICVMARQVASPMTSSL